MACPSFTAMVFWCGGGLFSAPESVQREKVGKRLLFYRVSEGTLESFLGAISWLVRPIHCHGVLVWRKAVFSTRFNTRERVGKVSFCRIADVTLGSSLVRFRGLSVLHCHGVQRGKRC